MQMADARAMMRSRGALERGGYSSRAIATSVASREIRRLDRGWYVEGAEWDRLYSEGRHLLRVLAAHERQPGSSSFVFSHCSAAVLWGLPLFRVEPRRVHVSGIHANGHVAGGDPLIARHEVAVGAAEITVVGGIRCTSLSRTVADAIRFASEETAVSIADAALRLVAWNDPTRSYDVAAAESLRAQVRAHLPRGARGVRRARWVMGFADGRAQLPGESVSRLYLHHLGFAAPRLQVFLPGPDGSSFAVDFGLDDADAWGEFDGLGKYTDPTILAGRDTATAVLDEKRREDWIRGTTHRKFGRWESAHIRSAESLGARLASFHISPR